MKQSQFIKYFSTPLKPIVTFSALWGLLNKETLWRQFMKKFLPIVGLLATTLLTGTAMSAKAGCDDNISYMVTKNGQCLDLTDFTKLGILEAEVADARRQENPIVFSELRIVRASKDSPYWYVVGTVTNQSRKPIYLKSATLRMTENIKDGGQENVQIEDLPILENLAPGETAKLKEIFLRKAKLVQNVYLENPQYED